MGFVVEKDGAVKEMGIGRRVEENEATKGAVKPAKEGIVFVPETPKYTMDDLILPARVREQILDIAAYAANSKHVFEDWGLAKTHPYSKRLGINLYGPSGTGKTMAAHAIASYLRRPILIVNYADIESKYVGETPKNIRKAFNAAKETGSILFFDEADAILSRRVTDMTSATDVSVNQTRSVLLMLLNEYEDFILFATNFIENFDPAFMRRISLHIKFELPDYDCRFRLWQRYIPKEMPNDLDCAYLAGQYAALTGSDIANAVLLAAFKAARHGDSLVSQAYVEEMLGHIRDGKAANAGQAVTTEKRVVSEAYVRQQVQPEDKQTH